MSTSSNAGGRVKIGVLTVSDRASQGEYEDRGGPAVMAYLNRTIKSQFSTVGQLVADDLSTIERAFVELSDHQRCCLIIATGGTGPAIRDVTPEALENVCDKLLPGFGESMRGESLKHVPTAILSRQSAGIRSCESGGTLIITLPGSPKAIAECLDAVFAAVPYCVELIGGPVFETNQEYIVSFRPKNN